MITTTITGFLGALGLALQIAVAVVLVRKYLRINGD
jgi:hypothetical protein